MTSRKKPGLAFWATVVAVVALVGYPLSFGPACWWFSDSHPIVVPGPKYAPQPYWPVGMAMKYVPGVWRIMSWYGLPSGEGVLVVPAAPGHKVGWEDQPVVVVRGESLR